MEKSQKCLGVRYGRHLGEEGNHVIPNSNLWHTQYHVAPIFCIVFFGWTIDNCNINKQVHARFQFLPYDNASLTFDHTNPHENTNILTEGNIATL